MLNFAQVGYFLVDVVKSMLVQVFFFSVFTDATLHFEKCCWIHIVSDVVFVEIQYIKTMSIQCRVFQWYLCVWMHVCRNVQDIVGRIHWCHVIFCFLRFSSRDAAGEYSAERAQPRTQPPQGPAVRFCVPWIFRANQATLKFHCYLTLVCRTYV